MTTKMHAIKVAAKYPQSEVSATYCGLSGLQERHSSSEYITMDGRDATFEVAMRGEKPTCKRCIAGLSLTVKDGGAAS